MDNEFLNLALVGKTTHLPQIAQNILPTRSSVCVEERRGEAMGRVIPMHSVGRARERESGVARQVYAYLAEATTNDDPDRRIRFPPNYQTEWNLLRQAPGFKQFCAPRQVPLQWARTRRRGTLVERAAGHSSLRSSACPTKRLKSARREVSIS